MKVRVDIYLLNNHFDNSYLSSIYVVEEVNLSSFVKNYFDKIAPKPPYFALQHIFSNVVFNHSYIKLPTDVIFYLHTHQYVFTELD